VAKGTGYKWVGTVPQDMPGGRMVEPGESVEISADALKDPYVQELIEAELLIPDGGGSSTTSKEGGG